MESRLNIFQHQNILGINSATLSNYFHQINLLNALFRLFFKKETKRNKKDNFTHSKLFIWAFGVPMGFLFIFRLDPPFSLLSSSQPDLLVTSQLHLQVPPVLTWALAAACMPCHLPQLPCYILSYKCVLEKFPWRGAVGWACSKDLSAIRQTVRKEKSFGISKV